MIIHVVAATVVKDVREIKAGTKVYLTHAQWYRLHGFRVFVPGFDNQLPPNGSLKEITRLAADEVADLHVEGIEVKEEEFLELCREKNRLNQYMIDSPWVAEKFMEQFKEVQPRMHPGWRSIEGECQ